MIVCSCHAVSDQALRLAAAHAASAAEVAALTGAGTDCGCCREDVEAIVAESARPCRADPCPGCPKRAS
jgi:bacterioferritin-associated ferredoxin